MHAQSDIGKIIDTVIATANRHSNKGSLKQSELDSILNSYELSAKLYSFVESNILEAGITIEDDSEMEFRTPKVDRLERDGFGAFIGRIKPRSLSADEVVTLAKRVESGQLAAKALEIANELNIDALGRDELKVKVNDGLEARNEFAMANIRLVISIAKKFLGNGVALEDLVQDGWFGLTRAVEKYDYRKGFRFSTYATHWIMQSMQRSVMRQSNAIVLPADTSQKIKQILATERQFEVDHRRKPTSFEISEATGLTESNVVQLLRYSSVVLSLDMSLNDGDSTLQDYVATSKFDEPENAFDLAESTKPIDDLLIVLTEKQREIVKLRNGFNEDNKPYSLEKVAKEMGHGSRCIRRLEGQALETLRKELKLKGEI